MKSIADVVSAAGLYQYAEVALLIFFAVFIAVTLRVLSANKASMDRAAHLPLADEPGDLLPVRTMSQSRRGGRRVER